MAVPVTGTLVIEILRLTEALAVTQLAATAFVGLHRA